MANCKITNQDNVIDKQDVQDFVDEQDEEIGACEDAIAELEDQLSMAGNTTDEERAGWQQELQDKRDELEDLRGDSDFCACKEFLEQASGLDGPFISDSHFDGKFAEQMADDLGLCNSGEMSGWPYTCIDWEQAARELQQDCTPVDFDGETYWAR